MASKARSTSPAKPVQPVVEPSAPAAVPTQVTIKRPKTCGEHFVLFGDASLAAEGCKRLPRHHGDHVTAKPRGLMTPSERTAVKAAKRVTKSAGKAASKAPKGIASRLVTVGGKRIRVFADGTTKVTSTVKAAKVARKPVTRTATKSAKPAAKRVVIATAKPVRVIPMAKSRRRVASTSGR